MAYLCTLDSFGVPFFAAFAPATKHATDLIFKGRILQILDGFLALIHQKLLMA